MKESVYMILLLLSVGLYSQEIIVNTKFAVRDFKIKDSTLVYIEKRNIKSVNLQTKKPDTLFTKNSFFIGGYGLNIFYPKDTNQIITASNELVRNVSSIRFYDLQKKAVNKYEVLYPTELMDFLIIPEKRLFFLSKKDLSIEIFKYGSKPRYQKQNVITLDSFARKMQFYNEKLYYITDSGKLYEYDFELNKVSLLYQGNTILVNFVINDIDIFITTDKGEVVKVNMTNKETSKLKVSNEIIEAIAVVDTNKIVVGDWAGNIYVLSNQLENIHQFKLKKRIIKIRSNSKNVFFTSSDDFTIRKWHL